MSQGGCFDPLIVKFVNYAPLLLENIKMRDDLSYFTFRLTTNHGVYFITTDYNNRKSIYTRK